jgi:indoleacetamide hydrolase
VRPPLLSSNWRLDPAILQGGLMMLANGAIRNIVALAAVLPTICCVTPAIAVPPSDGDRHVLLPEQVSAIVPERLLSSLTATQALAEFRSGRLTSERYVQALIRRIQRFPELNAVIHIEPAEALAVARAADHARAGGDDAPLLGLPILLKDSIDTDSLPTTGGTPALAGAVLPDNAAIVDTLLEAGAIVLGKTNLHELSAGYTTTNLFTGATRNPYDLDRVPGGSSGGNGAAIAALLAPVALGEDTAGSVRVPAALTGIYGFRPTSGRYSGDGVVPLSPTLDTIGPMARSVEDIVLLDGVITGDNTALDRISLRDLRIGLPRSYFRELLDPAVERAINMLVARLRDRGVEIVEVDIPIDASLTAQASLGINLFEAPIALTNYLAERGVNISLGELAAQVADPGVQFLLQAAISGAVSEADYLGLIHGLLPLLEASYVQYLDTNDLDAVILPTNIAPAPRIGKATVTVSGITMSNFDAFFRLGHYLPLVRAPTLSLPIGQLPGGLPVGGIDLAGRPGDDRRILAIGDALSPVIPRIRPPRMHPR